MLMFLLSTVALVGAQTVYDSTYQFGNLQAHIEGAVVFDCGTNPNRAVRNPKFTFSRNDLELPGTFAIASAEVEVTKPIIRPLYGKVEAWRAIWLFGGIASTIQLPCIPITNSVYGVGTCEELCAILDTLTPTDEVTGLPTCWQEALDLGIAADQCTCEGIIAPKVYTINDWNLLVNLTGIEAGIITLLAEGDYEIRMTATDDAGAEEACIGIRVPVKQYVDPLADSGWLFGRKKRQAPKRKPWFQKHTQ